MVSENETGPGGSFTVRPDALHAVTGNVAGTLLSTVSTVSDLAATLLAATSFAQIGSPIATAHEQLTHHQDTALRLVTRILTVVNDDVRRSAQGYADADTASAQGFGAPASHELWTGPVATRLAEHAVGDSAGVSGDPHAVGPVLGYLDAVGLGHPGSQTGFAGPTEFADWLDGDAAHQAQVGLIGVYDGRVRDLGDIPGGLRGGDVVVVSTSAGDGHELIGVATARGQLLNHGPVDPDFSAGADVRVYRPITAMTGGLLAAPAAGYPSVSSALPGASASPERGAS